MFPKRQVWRLVQKLEGVKQDRIPRALPNATTKIVAEFKDIGRFTCEAKSDKDFKKNRAFLTQLAKIQAGVRGPESE